MSQSIKQILPNEIIDQILLKLNDVEIAVELDRYYVVKQIYNLENLCDYKVDWVKEYGYLEFIKHLQNKKFTIFQEGVIDVTAKLKYLVTLKYMYRYESNPYLVTRNAPLDVVKFMHKFDVCTVYTIEEAAKNGHLDVVKFLYRTGSSSIIFKNKSYTIYNSDINKHLAILQTQLLPWQQQLQIQRQLRQRLNQLGNVPPDTLRQINSYSALDLIYRVKTLLEHQLNYSLQNSPQHLHELIYQQFQLLQNPLQQVLTQQLLQQNTEQLIQNFQNIKNVFTNSIDSAIENNHLDVAEFLHSIGVGYTSSKIKNIMIYAIETNNVEKIKFLTKFHIEPSWDYSWQMPLNWAITNDHLEIVKLLHIKKVVFYEGTQMLACQNNKLGIVKFLHDVGLRFGDHEMACVIKENYFEIAKFLNSIGVKFPMDAMSQAIENKNIQAVKLLYEKGIYDDQTMIVACEYGNLEIIKFLYENGVKCNEYAIIWASRKGHLNVVEYLHRKGVKCTPRAMSWAIGNKHFEVAKFLHNIGINHPVNSMIHAYKNKDILTMKFLHEIGESYPDDAIYLVVRDGNLEMVRLLHSIGAQCNKNVMTCASRNNDLEMVKLLHELGVECSTRALNMATAGGHSEVYKFLKSIKK
jgi:ankyrin repeat protein